MFGLKVAKIDNSALSLTDLIKRHLFDFIELLFVPIIPVVVELISNKQQRFGDILAKTKVVPHHSRASPS